jgi:hypothetical protein
MIQRKNNNSEPDILEQLFRQLEIEGVSLKAVNLRRGALNELFIQAQRNNRKAAFLLTRALKNGTVHHVLTRWWTPSGENALAAQLDTALYLDVCRTLYRFWYQCNNLKLALSCVSAAVFLHAGDPAKRFIDRGALVRLCFELGQYERTASLVQNIIHDLDLDAEQSLDRLGDGIHSLPLSAACLLYLHILKCKAFEKMDRPNWAETYYSNTTTDFAARANLDLPDWLPSKLRDRISSVVCTAPGQARVAV